ncbi:hypothetical protein [Sphingopyxis macrogoltabida]|uniref:Uncharacterized protein n=1 Tax=Sphingopyxis macrogoltabida TaxID=33050 RepID=A0AAC8Z139_SPHMC|nr:hypothetical protein [Sphingopyxis macrogoltabida]ALJ12597.1 hypothetical protein LH19_06935 [Sphingopyxis macrogoltabida]AMU89931.1 hypothetical protein ATM17_12880 [Sphingopyxis macrogoltabida]
MSKHYDPLAFPSVCLNDPEHPASVPGMGLRDWFAGQALSATVKQAFDEEGPSQGFVVVEEKAVVWAYSIADAMLAERGRGQ